MAFLKSFKYAFMGVKYCIATQRNFRFHTFAALSAVILACRYGLSGIEKLVLAFTIAFVLISEMFNTALESVVDMTANGYNDYAKAAKDVAAGAVLISAVTAALTGIILFYNHGHFWTVLFEYLTTPLFWVYIAFGFLYVSGVLFEIRRKK